MSLTAEQFDALFDNFATSASSTEVFRLEALQSYHVPSDDPFMSAFRDGRPRPLRSVRNSPWLARMANSVINEGKRWRRTHLVCEPLSEYLQMEMQGYLESQAAGEQITIQRVEPRELLNAGPDYWLFEDGAYSADGYAVVMNYDETGRVRGFEFVDDPRRLLAMRQRRDSVFARSVELNEYLIADSLAMGVPAARAAS